MEESLQAFPFNVSWRTVDKKKLLLGVANVVSYVSFLVLRVATLSPPTGVFTAVVKRPSPVPY